MQNTLWFQVLHRLAPSWPNAINALVIILNHACRHFKHHLWRQPSAPPLKYTPHQNQLTTHRLISGAGNNTTNRSTRPQTLVCIYIYIDSGWLIYYFYLASSYYPNVAAAADAMNTTTAISITAANDGVSHTTSWERPRTLADKDGHFIVRNGDYLTDRYQIHELLGQGTYGKVVKCYDHVRRCYVAIKIIRAIPKYKEASQTEIRVLDTLKENDQLNFNQCIHLVECFEYCNHVCMVFELLDQSVFDFLKANHFEPFPISHIQQFAKQLLTSVAFTHELKIIHTDLKPENILLKSRASSEIQNPRSKHGSMRVLHSTDIVLIDFGSATFEEDYHSSVVSTRHYRAPEIILGLGWSYPCDVWSIGCILVEFFTGEALFQTHDNLEHLAMMEMVLGKIPARLIQAASPEAAKYFRNGRLCYPPLEVSPQSLNYVKSLNPLRNIIVPKTRANAAFMDLIQRMLTYDPAKRITAREALRHRFFHIDFDQYGDEVQPSG
ncbi:kinase-like domain-containing protein [Dichotomocladium elegans]|nr:kinase-like domain-containing protein [Dichotomocladium elegans]